MHKSKMCTIVKEIQLPNKEKFEEQYKYIKEAVSISGNLFR